MSKWEIYEGKTIDELLKLPSIPTVEISGIGPQYEDACQVILFRTLKWLENKSIKDLLENGEIKPEVDDELTKLTDDLNPSGAMFNSSISHAFYIKHHSYTDWLNACEDRIIMWRPHLDLK